METLMMLFIIALILILWIMLLAYSLTSDAKHCTKILDGISLSPYLKDKE